MHDAEGHVHLSHRSKEVSLRQQRERLIRRRNSAAMRFGRPRARSSSPTRRMTRWTRPRLLLRTPLANARRDICADIIEDQNNGELEAAKTAPKEATHAAPKAGNENGEIPPPREEPKHWETHGQRNFGLAHRLRVRCRRSGRGPKKKSYFNLRTHRGAETRAQRLWQTPAGKRFRG